MPSKLNFRSILIRKVPEGVFNTRLKSEPGGILEHEKTCKVESKSEGETDRNKERRWTDKVEGCRIASDWIRSVMGDDRGKRVAAVSAEPCRG
ncbi:hypothetical protein KQX54_020960 [Cotesia glomerata]|uniref:Uncharacterized protein n=1 Tax=Cotesia glomerata TaxID=32391 RepID=A0AAV7I2X6_COTGL|nr:hypothetical protein KQX54_020960 [Cotesia glomerata]